ncbi:conserved hypothetical protein [Candidatus Terasakiella magnetica]|uniref:Thoeris anti-defense 2-like domain-containing protein n=1 Tax=Candidatus Terasakiella magnetica TaxID=1867952 RepID=A0A1C3RC89_9PROT|nr:MW1434 family type I TA system toxin [Candidatus Terasakiella magnetica]SCA54832.1 conserved hypothetical protein [Candidatus Terasakiella magnetica]
MTFDKILPLLLKGEEVSRAGWSETMKLFIDENTIYQQEMMATYTASRFWIPSQYDLMSDDWKVVDACQ